MSSIRIDNNPWWVKRGKERVVRGMDVLNGTFDYERESQESRGRETRRKADEYFRLLEKVPNRETLRFHIMIANYLLSERGQTKHKAVGENETIKAYEGRRLYDDYFNAPSEMVRYRDAPGMIVNFEQDPASYMEKATMVGTMDYYNTSAATIIEELFEYFDGSAGNQHSRTNAWPYSLEELKDAGKILVEKHDKISLKLSIELARAPDTHSARVLKTKIEIGDFEISFGNGRCRPDYDFEAQHFFNMHHKDYWMEIGTLDESVIFHKESHLRSFSRAPKISKMLVEEQRHTPKVSDLVHMVYPDGKFFVDEDKDLRDNSFPKTEEIRYTPPFNF